MTKREPQEAKDANVKWFQQWIRPLVIPLLFVTVAGTRVIDKVDRNEKEIRALRAQLDRHRIHSSDGFLDSDAHGSIDQHIEHWHREVFGERGWRSLQSSYSTRNGGDWRP